MNTTHYHIMAVAGWVLNIAGHFAAHYHNPYAYFMQGLGLGLVFIGWMTIFLKNRNQKNEASSR